MNFELLFTKEVIPPSRCISNISCKRGLREDGQSIYSTILQFTTRHSSEDKRSMLDNSAFYLRPIYRSAAQSKYFLHFPFSNGRLFRMHKILYLRQQSCLRSDRHTKYFYSSVFPLFHSKPNPLSLCNQPSCLFHPLGTFSFMT